MLIANEFLVEHQSRYQLIVPCSEFEMVASKLTAADLDRKRKSRWVHMIFGEFLKVWERIFLLDQNDQIVTEVGINRPAVWHNPLTWFNSNWHESIGQALERVDKNRVNSVVIIHTNCHQKKAQILRLES